MTAVERASERAMRLASKELRPWVLGQRKGSGEWYALHSKTRKVVGPYVYKGNAMRAVHKLNREHLESLR